MKLDVLDHLLIPERVLQQQDTVVFWVLQTKTVKVLAELTEGVDVGEVVTQSSPSMYIIPRKHL